MRRKLLLFFSLLIILSLIACNKNNTPIKTIEGRVFYEIYVRSYADSDGDKIGDFNGITQKLDYLNGLGIKGIWLMPIQPSPSVHGYDVSDYKAVNPQYGSMSDFERLIDEAHKRDILVIIDFVINHTSTKHPWFQQAKDGNSKYRNYYRFKSKEEPKTGAWYSNAINNGSSNDYYYAYFWDQMPDLNYDNNDVTQEMVDIAKFWIDKGVDGFRFDAALHIFTEDELRDTNKVLLTTNVDFWKDFREKVRKYKKDVYLVGEVWTSQSTVAAFYRGLDSNFNFDLATKIVNTARSTGNLYYSKQIEAMYSTIGNFTDRVIDSPFLSNHDQTRVMTVLNNDQKLAAFCAEMYLTLKGTPFIYYGEEIGMLGDKPDYDIRIPFKWTNDKSGLDTTWYTPTKPSYYTDVVAQNIQAQDPNSLYNVYKKLINLRNSHSALSTGDFRYVKSTKASEGMFIRVNQESKEALLVIHNFSSTTTTLSIDVNNLQVIYQSQDNLTKNKNELAPKSTKVFVLPFESYQSYLGY